MLDKDRSALVLVDIQGKLATLMHDRENFFSNVNRMVKASRLFQIPILWNEQLPDKLGDTVPEIKSELSELFPLTKKTFSCCGNEKFVQALKETGRNQILLTGMETHICVYQTARDLLRDGYEVHLIADAVSSRFEYNRKLGIDTIKDLGGIISSVEMALFDMAETAEGDEFRELIKIVK